MNLLKNLFVRESGMKIKSKQGIGSEAADGDLEE